MRRVDFLGCYDAMCWFFWYAMIFLTKDSMRCFDWMPCFCNKFARWLQKHMRCFDWMPCFCNKFARWLQKHMRCFDWMPGFCNKFARWLQKHMRCFDWMPCFCNKFARWLQKHPKNLLECRFGLFSKVRDKVAINQPSATHPHFWQTCLFTNSLKFGTTNCG